MTVQWGGQPIKRVQPWYEKPAPAYDHRGLKHPIHGCPCRPCMCAMAAWCGEIGVPMPKHVPGG